MQSWYSLGLFWQFIRLRLLCASVFRSQTKTLAQILPDQVAIQHWDDGVSCPDRHHLGHMDANPLCCRCHFDLWSGILSVVRSASSLAWAFSFVSTLIILFYLPAYYLTLVPILTIAYQPCKPPALLAVSTSLSRSHSLLNIDDFSYSSWHRKGRQFDT